MLGGCPLTWASRLQSEIALSTTEAQYIALSTAMRDLLPTRALLKEIGDKMQLSYCQQSKILSRGYGRIIMGQYKWQMLLTKSPSGPHTLQ